VFLLFILLVPLLSIGDYRLSVAHQYIVESFITQK
jgi:hypothetical protein